MVSCDIDLTDLRFLFLVHRNQHTHITRVVLVIALQDMHLRVVVTLLGEVFLNHRLGMILQVGCHLAALTQAGLDLYILFLTLLQALVTHLADTRTLLQRNHQPDLVTLDLLRTDLHLREQSLFPETLHRLRDLVTRNLDLIAYRQTGETDQHKILVTVCSFHLDPGDLVRLAVHRVLDVGCRLRYSHTVLRIQRRKRKEER